MAENQLPAQWLTLENALQRWDLYATPKHPHQYKHRGTELAEAAREILAVVKGAASK